MGENSVLWLLLFCMLLLIKCRELPCSIHTENPSMLPSLAHVFFQNVLICFHCRFLTNLCFYLTNAKFACVTLPVFMMSYEIDKKKTKQDSVTKGKITQVRRSLFLQPYSGFAWIEEHIHPWKIAGVGRGRHKHLHKSLNVIEKVCPFKHLGRSIMLT